MIPSLATLSFANIQSIVVLVVSSVFIQPAAALACGAFARLGLVNPLFAFGIIFTTDIVMDCLWYLLGEHHGEKTWGFMSRLFAVNDTDLARVTGAFHAHPARIIITSKLLGGLGVMPAILFTAGASHMAFRRYILLNAVGELIWTTLLIGVGYFFSYWYLQVGNLIGKASVIALFAALAAGAWWLGRRARSRVIDTNESN